MKEIINLTETYPDLEFSFRTRDRCLVIRVIKNQDGYMAQREWIAEPHTRTDIVNYNIREIANQVKEMWEQGIPKCDCDNVETTDIAKRDNNYIHVLCKRRI